MKPRRMGGEWWFTMLKPTWKGSTIKKTKYPLVNKHSYWKLPFDLLIYPAAKWWVSIVMLVYQRVIWLLPIGLIGFIGFIFQWQVLLVLFLLVGGDWNHGILWLSRNSWEFHNPTDFHIFFRGVGSSTTNQLYIPIWGFLWGITQDTMGPWLRVSIIIHGPSFFMIWGTTMTSESSKYQLYDYNVVPPR